MITFFVPGIPKPGGSKRGFILPRSKRVVIVDASGKAGKDWRGDVKAFAIKAYQGPPLDEPLRLRVTFNMPRPKSHYKRGRLRDDAPQYHTIRPDATKLLRSLEDALTGILWVDDSRIASQVVLKIYSGKPGATVCVNCPNREVSV